MVRCSRLLPSSQLIVPLLKIFFIRVFSPLTFHLFSENILHERVAPQLLTSHKLVEIVYYHIAASGWIITGNRIQYMIHEIQ